MCGDSKRARLITSGSYYARYTAWHAAWRAGGFRVWCDCLRAPAAYTPAPAVFSIAVSFFFVFFVVINQLPVQLAMAGAVLCAMDYGQNATTKDHKYKEEKYGHLRAFLGPRKLSPTSKNITTAR